MAECGRVGLTPAPGLLADDHSRVLLTPEGSHGGSDYINASPIVSAPDAPHRPRAPAGRVWSPGPGVTSAHWVTSLNGVAGFNGVTRLNWVASLNGMTSLT